MSPPSDRNDVRRLLRRDLLRAGTLGFVTLAGCAGTQPSPETTSTTAETPTATATEQTATATETETTTAGESTRECDLKSLPGRGWPLPGRGRSNTNYAPSATGPTEEPSVRWKRRAEYPETDAYFEVRFTDPVVTTDRVFVGKALYPGTETKMIDGNYVHAYDREDGERVWTYPTGKRVPEAVAVLNDSVYVATGRSVHAIARDEGTGRWSFEGEGGVAGVTPTDGRAYVAGKRGTVSAVRDDGSVAWTASVGDSITERPTVGDGTVFVGSDGPTLTALRAEDGREVWSMTADIGESNTHERFRNITLTECAVFATADGDLYAIDDYGEVQWQAGGRYGSLSTDGETVYAGTSDGDVRALSATDGAVRWKRFFGVKEPNRVDGIAGLTVGSETVFVSVIWGGLRALGTDDGAERWSLSGEWEHPGTPVVVGDSVFLSRGKYLTSLG